MVVNGSSLLGNEQRGSDAEGVAAFALSCYPSNLAFWRSSSLFRWLGIFLIGLPLGLVSCLPTRQTTALPKLVFKHPRLLSREEPLRALLEQFRRDHPSIDVREEILPASSDQQHLFYVTNLEAQADDFDVFALDIIWIPEFRRAGWLHNLTPYLKPEELDHFLPAAIQAAVHNGQVYALPWFTDAGVLYYRRDLLEEYALPAPRTLTELTAIARQVLQRAGDPRLTGFVWQGKQYEGLICVALEFMRAYGGGIMDDQGRSLLTQPATAAGLQALRDMIAKDRISTPFVTTADEEMTRHIFMRGEAIFMRNWPYAWALLNTEDSPVRGRVGVTAVPGGPHHAAVPTLGGWHLGVNRFSKHPQLAWELIAFLTSTESQRKLAVAGGLKPTRVSVYHDPEAQQEDPSLSLFFPFVQAARPRPVTPFYLMLSQMLQGEISAAVTGIKPVDIALHDAERQLQRVLALDIPEATHAQDAAH
jgi:multiple sugar transport system substrate-binding protein